MTQTRATYRGFEGPSGAPKESVGYEVLDPMGHEIESAEKLFFNASGGLEYVRVWIGLLFERLVLIPVQDVAIGGATRSLTLK